jgi:hypothetical protein
MCIKPNSIINMNDKGNRYILGQISILPHQTRPTSPTLLLIRFYPDTPTSSLSLLYPSNYMIIWSIVIVLTHLPINDRSIPPWSSLLFQFHPNIRLDYSSHHLRGASSHRYTNRGSYSSTLLLSWYLTSGLIIHPIIYLEHRHTGIPVEHHTPPPSGFCHGWQHRS